MRYSRPCPIALAACSSAISVRRTGRVEQVDAARDRPRGHDDDVDARAVQRRDVLADARDDGQAQLARVVGDDGGAELDDRDGHAAGNATAGSTTPAPAGASRSGG